MVMLAANQTKNKVIERIRLGSFGFTQTSRLGMTISLLLLWVVAVGGSCSVLFGPADDEEPSGPLVSALLPTNYETDQLTVGARQYTDRDYTITTIPPRFENWLLIRTVLAARRSSIYTYNFR